jgi:hypothetical protein
MKKLATFVFALLLGASLSFAQNTSSTGSDANKGKTTTTDTAGKKGHKGGKKGHKGGKKGKKGSSNASTPAPK